MSARMLGLRKIITLKMGGGFLREVSSQRLQSLQPIPRSHILSGQVRMARNERSHKLNSKSSPIILAWPDFSIAFSAAVTRPKLIFSDSFWSAATWSEAKPRIDKSMHMKASDQVAALQKELMTR